MKLFKFKKKHHDDHDHDHDHHHSPTTTTTTTTLAPTYVVTSEITPVKSSPKQLINFGGICYNPHHTISEYGMVLNITGNPTIYDSHEVQGHSHHLGVDFDWNSELEYLFSEGMTYYLKAYVLIDGHYYYGDEKIYTPVRKKDRVLFIIKNNTYFNGQSQSYGLTNSSEMIAKYLETQGSTAKVVFIDDDSEIDVEVSIFSPDIVIIEALWLLSSKLNRLCDKYINIEWIVRIHSNVGFLAAEYDALELVRKYLHLKNKNLKISSNNKEFNNELSKVCYTEFKYLPNIVDFDEDEESECKNKYKNNTGVINIGCFGALRLLKNQLFQAMCAIDAADELGKKLKYHVNKDGESIDSPVLKNLIELFKINGKHELIIHEWMDHDKFVELIEEMNIGLQLSFSESFNLITSDFVVAGVPILVSEAITWMPEFSIVSTVDFHRVARKIVHMYHSDNRITVKTNKLHLIRYNNESKEVWNEFIER